MQTLDRMDTSSVAFAHGIVVAIIIFICESRGVVWASSVGGIPTRSGLFPILSRRRGCATAFLPRCTPSSGVSADLGWLIAR